MRRPLTFRDRSAPMSERLAALERENGELKARLAELTEEAARNEALLRKTQSRELDLLQAGSLVQLLDRLISGLKIAYQLDAVALVLHDPHHETRHLLSGDGFGEDRLAEVLFVDSVVTLAPQLAALERPWLGPYRAADHELLVPRSAGLGSQQRPCTTDELAFARSEP